VNEASKRLADPISKLGNADSDDAAKRANDQIDGLLQSIEEVIQRNAALFQTSSQAGGATDHNHGAH
jgi:hypothetical protein